eukprot:scaffold64683_cov39-Phaeocystis_antarctica.AAC.1
MQTSDVRICATVVGKRRAGSSFVSGLPPSSPNHMQPYLYRLTLQSASLHPIKTADPVTGLLAAIHRYEGQGMPRPALSLVHALMHALALPGLRKATTTPESAHIDLTCPPAAAAPRLLRFLL